MTTITRRLLTFALLYICIEGLVVNMTFPSKIGFVLKDAALVLAYVTFFGSPRQAGAGSLAMLKVPIAIFAVVQTAYLLPPEGLPLIARLVGWKMRLLYIPVMFLAYAYLRTIEDYRRLVYILVAAAVPVSMFGIYLYFAGSAPLRSMGGTYSAMVYSTTGVWRVPGTFTSPGQYGHYLTFNCLLAISLLIGGGMSGWRRTLLWGALAVMIVAMMCSGSRTPLVIALACVAMTTVSMGRVGKLVSMGMVLYVVFAVAFATLGAGVADRVDSIASTDHIDRFRDTYFGNMFLHEMKKAPLGIGLGAATIGARHFTEFGEVILMESYFGIVGIETGFVGLLAILMLTAAVVLMMWRGRPIMKSAPAEGAAPWHLMALFTVMAVLLSPVGTLLDAAPANVYFWLAAGIAARLYDLERWRLVSGIETGAPEQPQMYQYVPPGSVA